MKKILVLAAIAAIASSAAYGRGSSGHSGGYSSRSFSGNSGGSHSIRGYTRKDGTYVAPAHATNPNSSRADNWSAKGNTNPYTGKKGTKDPVTGK